MGSDYYAYAVIGVKAGKYAKDKHVKYEVQKTVGDGYFSSKPSQPVFDAEGKPVMRTVSAGYIEFLGKNYMSDEFRKGRSEIGGVKFEEGGDFVEHLDKHGLDWISYDYNCIYCNDVIGMKIAKNDDDSDGVAEDQLPALFAEARWRLTAVGITEEPKLYASFYHSY